jgi:hypothetical protein
LPKKPGARERPVAVGGPSDHSQRRRRFVLGQSGEHTELDQGGGAGVFSLKPGKGGVEVEQVVRRSVEPSDGVELKLLAPS